MITFYTDIFSYHHKYNQIVIDFLQSHTNVEMKKANDWMTHILESHEIWLDRIKGNSNQIYEWKQLNLWSAQELMNYKRTLDIIKNQSMDHPVRYQNSQGKAYINTVSEILYHISNHTAHHRGMIIADIRNSGMEPPVTDYIFDKR